MMWLLASALVVVLASARQVRDSWGVARWRARTARSAGTGGVAVLRRVGTDGTRLLSGRYGPLVVLLSAVTGVPPLLAVAFWAGTSSMAVASFVAACLTGRSLRFVALGLAPGLLL